VRHAADLAAVRAGLALLPTAAQNAALRAIVAEVRICGKDCEVVPLPWLSEVIAEAGRLGVAA
jgi:hypothetical protein